MVALRRTQNTINFAPEDAAPGLNRMPSLTKEQQLAKLRFERDRLDQRAKRLRLEELKRERDYLTKEDESWYEDFAEGLGVSGLELLYGIQALMPAGLRDEEKARLKDWKRDAGESGFGTAGQVVGEIAQLLLPASGVMKGLKGVSALNKTSKAVRGGAMLAADTGIAAGLGAARLPEDDETRGGEAASDAMFTLAGVGTGALLNKGMRGLAKTKEAQKLLDEGLYLTPGWQAQSKAIQNLETAAEVTPFLARGTQDARKEALEGWNKLILQQSAPRGVTIDKVGVKGVKQLKNAVKQGYDDAWKGVPPISTAVRERLANRLMANMGRLSKKEKGVITSIHDDMTRLSSAKKLDSILRREIQTTLAAGAKRRDLRLVLEKVRRDLRKVAPQKNQKALRYMDSKYPEFLTIQDASARSKKLKGVFVPDQLIMSSAAVGKKPATAIGEAPLQQAAYLGSDTVGMRVGGAPLDFFRRLSGAFPSPWGMRGAGEFLMGNTRPQQAISAALDSPRAEALRYILRPSAAGYAAGAYSDEAEP